MSAICSTIRQNELRVRKGQRHRFKRSKPVGGLHSQRHQKATFGSEPAGAACPHAYGAGGHRNDLPQAEHVKTWARPQGLSLILRKLAATPQNWVWAIEIVPRKLERQPGGHRQVVDILGAVLTDGLDAVEAASPRAARRSARCMRRRPQVSGAESPMETNISRPPPGWNMPLPTASPGSSEKRAGWVSQSSWY